MDEKRYKSTYSDINPNRCVFEKSINSRVCSCNKSQRFNLADREGVACASQSSLHRCEQLLLLLHNKARFVLRKLEVNKLGHAQEMKIQNGGLLGLQRQVNEDLCENVEDIDAVITHAVKKFMSFEGFPYSEIMQSITAYCIRPKRSRQNKE